VRNPTKNGSSWTSSGNPTICKQAARIDAYNPERLRLIEKAIALCPDLGSRSYYMKAEPILTNPPDAASFGLDRAMAPAVLALTKAVAAGRALSALICTNEFGHSNLYNYIQILWYIRSLYSLGSLHCFLGKS